MIYLLIVTHIITFIGYFKSFLCVTFYSKENFHFVTPKIVFYQQYTLVLCVTKICSRTVRELLEQTRTKLHLFAKFANSFSRTRTRDEQRLFFTNTRRTEAKSRSRRIFLFVFVFVVREPYLITINTQGPVLTELYFIIFNS